MTGGLGLVLSGGGAPAAYFGVGVAQAVAEAGLRPTLYSGVSAGALNAAALATGIEPTELAEVWRETHTGHVLRPRLDLWRLLEPRAALGLRGSVLDVLLGSIGWTWTLSTRPARTLLTGILGGEAVEVSEGTTLVVSAVDQGSAELIRFANRLPEPDRRGPEFVECALTVDHLLARRAAPLLFPSGRLPELPDRDFVDAGLVSNTPLKPALAYEPDAAQTVNDLVDAAPDTPRKKVEILLVEPRDFAFSAPAFLRFDPDDADRVIEHGVRMGRLAIAGWAYADRTRVAG